MKPRMFNILIILAMLLGLGLTQSCGSSGSSSSSVSAGTDRGGVTITNEVTSPADMSVGDIMMVQFGAEGTSEFDFEGVEEGSSYYLAVASLEDSYSSYSVQMGSSLSDPLDSRSLAEAEFENKAEEAVWENWTADDAFQQRLRDVGFAMAVDPETEIAGDSIIYEDDDDGYGSFKAAIVSPSESCPDYSVGDTEELNVLNSLTSLSSYATVTARIHCVTDNMVFYIDTEFEDTNPDDLTTEDIQLLCDNFDEQVIWERNAFGSESDVNSDCRVAALLTPQVNRLGASGGGIITGFFLASDLFAKSGSNGISNEREIVYALVPDSRGYYGTVLPKTFTIENLLTAVLPHEFQHVISYNQHVFVGSEGVPESAWLNEGLSHLTEDLVGYGQENYSRVSVFFNYPSYYQLVASGSPGLGQRGAAYLFMRFLYEQHSAPDSFLRALYTSNAHGVANLELAYDGATTDFDQFGEFYMRWITALAMNDRGLSQDEKYVYEERVWDEDTERWKGFCTVCSTEDGRGTVLTGPYFRSYTGDSYYTVYSSSVRFYNISTPPEKITFSGSSAAEFGAVLVRKE